MADIVTSGVINLGKTNRKRNTFQAESPLEKQKKHAIYQVGRDCGKYIQFSSDEYGILLTVCRKCDEICYAYMDKDKNVKYVNISNEYKFMKSIPMNCSVLDYIKRHDVDALSTAASIELNKTDEVYVPVNLVPSRKNVKDVNKKPVKKNVK